MPYIVEIEEVKNYEDLENFYKNLEFPYTYNFFHITGNLFPNLNGFFTEYCNYGGVDRLNLNLIGLYLSRDRVLFNKNKGQPDLIPQFLEKVGKRYIHGPGRIPLGSMSIIYIWELFLLVNSIIYDYDAGEFKRKVFYNSHGIKEDIP
jgi:hypothetical protein